MTTNSCPITAPPQRRGKSLARRKYQRGYVFQKGRRKSDSWAADEPAYIRFWKDVPGQPESKHGVASLGICRTRTITERRGAERLEKLGINSTQRFIEATSTIAFRQHAECWLSTLATLQRI